MNGEYLVPTGRLIKDYLDEYNISQKSLSSRTGMSEKHISNVINGNSRLTEEFVLKLEKVLTNINASYWLNYEAKYREYIARQEEKIDFENLDLASIATRFRFKEVFKGLELNIVEQAVEMLKLLKISSFDQFEKVYGDLAIDFMEDGGESEAIAVWLGLCESEIEIQNVDLTENKFDKKKVEKALDRFRILANNKETEKSIVSCRKLFNRLGIYFVVCEAITNSKVRGALTTYNNHPAIYISGRFRSHAHIWFAIIHEIFHLLLHYDKKELLISYEEENENAKETEANQHTRNLLVNAQAYHGFVDEGQFSKEKIISFSQSQDILPEFIVGFLQHDGIIGFDKLNNI
ncbi:MAG: DNA-binding protein [Firmicutes bacterium HGW-Firmicutes-2]|jgi:plasmid maintenance system antidote protein VapI/Zn-dependent peptidase ImmA (M78 family)|nr:MAG: DNA-binding protein [Firmicutes bacterium HGW-Firmicutes-2]